MLELLIVIGVITLLIAILMPAISAVRHQARQAVCASHMREIGAAIFSYASDFDNSIPFGPVAPTPALKQIPNNFYWQTGEVTSLISLLNGQTVGLGLMIKKQLADTKKILFCPDTDQSDSSDYELSLVGTAQAQCDYYYRHGSVASLFKGASDPSQHIRLGHLGNNSQNVEIKALAMDVNFFGDAGLAMFGAPTRTCHNGGQSVNVLFADGHVQRYDNGQGQFTFYATMPIDQSLYKIMAIFEYADGQ